jgi:hypothetical protein
VTGEAGGGAESIRMDRRKEESGGNEGQLE